MSAGKLQVKIITRNDARQLQTAVNDFLARLNPDTTDVIANDIKYQVTDCVFSVLIPYYEADE